MLAWWCAGLSFWGAAGLLALLAAVDALIAAGDSRRQRAAAQQRQAGEPAR